jgi:basic membrane protein A and related proteins
MMRAACVLAGLLGGALLLTGEAAPANGPLRVGFVTIVGNAPTSRIIDGGFLGFARASKRLDIQAKVIYVAPTEDGTRALESLARQRYDLIVVGLPDPTPADSVARRFPDVRFLLPDAPLFALPHRPRNVQGTIFRRQEAGYLAGYLAALVEDRLPGRHVISSVGGYPGPGVDIFIAGYQAGAHRADPHIHVLNRYSRDFADPSKCRAVARDQVAKGSGVLFNVAGNCGLGTLAVAREKRVWGVGVDVDQSFLGPHILTSAVIRIDDKVFERIRAFVHGKFVTGRTTVYGVGNDGVGLGKISGSVARRDIRRVEKIRRQIAAGKITVPSTLGKQ